MNYFIGLLEKLYPAEATKVPIAEIASHRGGKLYEEFSGVSVMPALEVMNDKFQLMPEGVAQEFAVLAKEAIIPSPVCFISCPW